MNILELFSGIGSMHTALNLSNVRGDVACAVDCDAIANFVYSSNFANRVITDEVESLTPDLLTNQGINAVFMAPPKSPFVDPDASRSLNDPRTQSILHFLNLLPQAPQVDRILIENVPQFANTPMYKRVINQLLGLGFNTVECVLCPRDVGIPNKEERYYCVAKKTPLNHNVTGIFLPTNSAYLDSFLDVDFSPDFLVSPEYYQAFCSNLNIVHRMSDQYYFTKNYSGLFPNRESILMVDNYTRLKIKLEPTCKIEMYPPGEDHPQKIAQCYRFFTPKEISRFMGFPEGFIMPSFITKREQYRYFAKSAHCTILAKLIKLLE